MNANKDLKEIIVVKAGELFRQQGYAATSIKQIAQASGCTTAALYYYFEGGKEEISRAVLHSPPLRETQVLVIEAGKEAKSLEEYLLQFGQALAKVMPQLLGQVNWLVLEFASLPEEDKALLHQQFLTLQSFIFANIKRYVADENRAMYLAWLVASTYFGYSQLFINLEGDKYTQLNLEEFVATLARVVGREADS